MTERFNKKDEKLEKTGGLTDHELDDAHITDHERDDLATKRHVKQRDWQERITLEMYLDAKRKLDTPSQNAAERESAQKIVDEYDRQGNDKQSETTM